jgi:mannose-6-phosphate isomerase-like protein (cupin superfamily)
LLVIDGEIEVTLLLNSERPRSVLGPGMACVIPKQVWHSPVPQGPVTLLSLADYRSTRGSDADDPR